MHWEDRINKNWWKRALLGCSYSSTARHRSWYETSRRHCISDVQIARTTVLWRQIKFAIHFMKCLAFEFNILWIQILHCCTMNKSILEYVVHFDGLMQERRNCSALAMELCLYCTILSITSIFSWSAATYFSTRLTRVDVVGICLIFLKFGNTFTFHILNVIFIFN